MARALTASSEDEASDRPDAETAFPRELFDDFPYGLLIVDRDRRIVLANSRARDLLARSSSGPAATPATCCPLLCDRVETGATAGCLAERALSADGPLPEVRVDLPGQGSPPVWVTVSAIEPHRVVFHLRSAEVGDRRRRSDAQLLDSERLRVFTFGQTRVESAQLGSVSGDWIEQRPGQVLKYLVSRRNRIVTAEEIAQALWPQSDTRALSSVRYFLHVLRARLEPLRAARTRSAFIVARDGGYALIDERVWVDALEFDELVGTGLAALIAGDRDGATGALQDAIGLYRGDFLADEPYAEWALHERERFQELAGRALRALTELALAGNELDSAASYARRLADLEPYDSDAQRRHIEVCLRRGRRTEAVRRYELFSRRLAREFGERPDFPAPAGS